MGEPRRKHRPWVAALHEALLGTFAAMASKLLDHRRILDLHAATIAAGLAGHRAALLQGIDAAFVARLPVSPSPSAQILTDLHGLDLTLDDGSIPLGLWHRIGLCRFEPGELDDLLPEGKKLRLPDDYTFLPPR